MHKNEYPRLKKLTVVYAEDEAEIRDIASGFFKPYFANFVAAPNGMEAYKIIKELKPDVLITDIMMPMQNGSDLIRRIQQHPGLAAMPILLLSSAGTDRPLDACAMRACFGGRPGHSRTENRAGKCAIFYAGSETEYTWSAIGA